MAMPDHVETAQTYSTSDIAVAAYLKSKGLKLAQTPRKTGSKFSFVFVDENGAGRRLALEFINSECAQFDAAIRDLKRLMYNTGS